MSCSLQLKIPFEYTPCYQISGDIVPTLVVNPILKGEEGRRKIPPYLDIGQTASLTVLTLVEFSKILETKFLGEFGLKFFTPTPSEWGAKKLFF